VDGIDNAHFAVRNGANKGGEQDKNGIPAGRAPAGPFSPGLKHIVHG
jgi:hypothetical protein